MVETGRPARFLPPGSSSMTTRGRPERSRSTNWATCSNRRLERSASSSIQQAEERSAARQAWTERDLVATTAMGTPLDRNNLNRSVRRLCAEVEIDPPVTPYELRHTAITHQCEAGPPHRRSRSRAQRPEREEPARHLIDENDYPNGIPSTSLQIDRELRGDGPD